MTAAVDHLRVLLVEDNPTDVLLLEDALADLTAVKCDIVRVERLVDGLQQLRRTHFDVVLLDLGLPDSQGVDTFVRLHEAAPDVPVLVLTALDDELVGVNALQAGAQDYLVKRQVQPSLLVRSVRYAIERHRNAAELDRRSRELAASEERFQLALGGSAAGLWDWDPRSDEVYFSTRFKEVLGYTEDEFGNTMAEYLAAIHPDDLARVRACREAHLAGNERFDVEFRVLTKQQELRWVHSRGQALWNETGVAYRMVGWILDVTERRQVEESFRLFRDLLDRSNDAIEVIDPVDGRLLDVNERDWVDLGYTREELLSLRVSDVDPTIPIEDWPAFVAEVKAGTSLNREGLHRRKDGTVFPVEANVRWVDRERAYLVAVVRDITERKRTEEQLRFHEAVLEETGRIAKVGGWSIDPRTGVGHWTEEVARIHEVDPAETPSLAFGLNFYPEKSRAKIEAALEAAIADGTPYDLELEFISARGTPKWVRTIGHPLMENGTVVRIDGSFQDITDRREAEATVRRNERRFRALIEGSADVIALLDGECRIVYQSPSVTAVEGYTPEELIGQSAYARVHPDDLGMVQEFCTALRSKAGHTRQLLWRCRHRDGRWVWLEGTMTNLLSDPAVKGIVANYRDVSERLEADRHIRRQAALLDQASDAIVVRDLDRTIRFWSQGAERIYGWTAEEVMGQDIVEREFRDPEAFAVALEELQRTGAWAGHLHHRRADGRELTVHARWTLLRDDAGTPQSILSFSSDVTEQKHLEAQFLRAQRMESVGTLAGGIAHDFNNVLSPIMMSIALLRMHIDDPGMSRILETLDASVNRGKQLVRQVLAFGRGVEGERVILQPLHIVREISDVVAETFPKSIQFKSAHDKDPWVIRGDPTQLHQVIMNLCVNARDAMPHGGQLTLELRNVTVDETYAAMNRDARPGRFVQVNVIDQGQGIPPELRDRIFEPFFTTKEVGHGTGLGLSTVLAIVKAHAGFINVYSEIGRGTTFHAYFPALEGSALNCPPTAAAEHRRGQGELVLVVDDESAIRDVACRTLERFGYRVILASNGAEGVSQYLARRDEIAVVLTDMAMPIMDGPAMIYALRSIDPAVRVVATSGLTLSPAATQLRELGVVHFLPKPYAAGTLLKILREALEAGADSAPDRV